MTIAARFDAGSRGLSLGEFHGARGRRLRRDPVEIGLVRGSGIVLAPFSSLIVTAGLDLDLRVLIDAALEGPARGADLLAALREGLRSRLHRGLRQVIKPESVAATFTEVLVSRVDGIGLSVRSP